RLFLAGVIPGLLLTAMFMAWAIIDARRQGYQFSARKMGYTLKEKMATVPRVAPLLIIILAIMFVLYGGVATPSEAAGAGAMLTLLVVVIVYRLFKIRPFVGIFGS